MRYIIFVTIGMLLLVMTIAKVVKPNASFAHNTSEANQLLQLENK